MAAIGGTLPTLLDQVKRTDPNGGIAAVIEQLQRRNTLLEDMTWMPGNLTTGHRFSSRTGLPAVGWRRYNEGVTPGKSFVDSIDETCGELAGMSVIDTEVAKLNGNDAAFRASEDMAFLQSMNNEVATSLFYASTKTNPERILGLAPRFDATTAIGGGQIVKCDAAASGNDQTSVWLVCHSPETFFGIYPKAQVGGLQMEDMGKQLWDDGTGKKFVAYVSNWRWKLGLVVKDWRYIVRIANIDTSALAANGTNLVEAMIRAYNLLQDTNTGRLAFYCNRTVATFLHLQARNAVTNSTLSIDMIGGKPVTSFLGVPVRVTDALLNTEAVVS